MAREGKGASSFDELAIGLSSGSISRGRALRLMGAALVGGILASTPTIAGAKPKAGKCNKDEQCPAGTTCVSNVCVTPEGCPPGYNLCDDGLCYDLTTDPCNCGTCGNLCQGQMGGRCCVPDSEGKGTCTPAQGVPCPGPDPNNGCPPGITPTPISG